MSRKRRTLDARPGGAVSLSQVPIAARSSRRELADSGTISYSIRLVSGRSNFQRPQAGCDYLICRDLRVYSSARRAGDPDASKNPCACRTDGAERDAPRHASRRRAARRSSAKEAKAVDAAGFPVAPVQTA